MSVEAPGRLIDAAAGATPMPRQLAGRLSWAWYHAGISDLTLRTGTHLDIVVDVALLRARLGNRRS